MINRRTFIRFLGATGVAAQGASAQTARRLFRLGLLNRAAPLSNSSAFGAALIRGLEKRGYMLGGNLVIERRGAEGVVERLPRLVDELAASKVDVILAISYPAAMAAKTGTSLPVVVYSTGDPVATGLVNSLAQPGGHLTGIADMTLELSPKRLQLLKEMVPDLHRVAMIWNASDAGMMLRYQASEAAARQLGIAIEPHGVRESKDFEPAFAVMSSSKPDAIFVVSDGLTIGHRQSLFDFAAAQRLPALYEDAESAVRDGGLMFYGPDLGESFDRLAGLIDRILKGAKPQDLPFEQPTRFRFVVNLKAAKALGLTIPPSILLRADEVIE